MSNDPFTNKRARSDAHNPMFAAAIKSIEKLADIESRQGAKKKQRTFHASEMVAVTDYLYACESAEAVRTDETHRFVHENYPTVTFHGNQLHVVINKMAYPIQFTPGKNLQAFSASMSTMKQVFYDPNYEVHFHNQSMNSRMQFCARQRIGKVAAMRAALDAEMADFNNELRLMKSNWWVVRKHFREHFKAKGIVHFWIGETQKSLCAPGGAGRAADAAAFHEDFAA